MAKSSRRQSKKTNLDNATSIFRENFELPTIKPLTPAQQHAFDKFYEDKHLVLHGLAGTGKTFCGMYLALDELFNQYDYYNKVTIIRSVVPTREMGYLPGSEKEKQKVFELPYSAICNELFGRDDAYSVLKAKNYIDFISTSFIRGTTLSNTIVLVDEINNMTFHELDSVITRMGHNCKMIFAGDFRQSDLPRSDKNGILNFLEIIKRMPGIELVEFGEEDIVRSGIVKDYIITRDRLGFAA